MKDADTVFQKSKLFLIIITLILRFNEHTSINDNEFPVYRRRKTDDENILVKRRDKNGRTLSLGNDWVAPYNPYLTKRYNCHIYVEAVGSTKSIKYLYKYIYKGHDVATIDIKQNVAIYDEIERHFDARYVCFC